MIASLSRTGDRRELLVGPLAYGAAITFVTAYYWRHPLHHRSLHLLPPFHKVVVRDSLVGIVSMMVLCAGDGFAALVGYHFGRDKLPWSSHKSAQGSVAFLLAAYTFTQLYVLFFILNGWVRADIELVVKLSVHLVAVVSVSALVETLPILESWDNVTVFLTAFGMMKYFGY